MSDQALLDEIEVVQKRGKQILEALLFAAKEPLSLERIKDTLESFYTFTDEEVLELLDGLNDHYKLNENAFHITEVGTGYILRTHPEFHPYLDILFRKKNTDRLSKTALEVLAIIAFKQPITRAQIEEIRGVDSSSLVQTLLERELIESAGKLETLGRPTIYRTTEGFLNYFGLKTYEELTGLAQDASNTSL